MLCNTFPLIYQLTIVNVLYFLVFVGQSSERGLTWYLGLKVSDEVASRWLAGAAVPPEA